MAEEPKETQPEGFLGYSMPRADPAPGNYITPASPHADPAAEPNEAALRALEQDTDAILARLEVGIAREREALDALLSRLNKAA